MTMPTMPQLAVLKCGSCEPLKASVHATALGLSALMGLYNAAAWLSRRDTHLAVNAVLYTMLAAWEQHHVAHHLALIRRASLDERLLEEVLPSADAQIAA
jgi:hypothetical protein